MRIDVQIVNAFIDGTSGGNPAGVVVDANALTAAQKLKIAQQVGHSETAFVSASRSATIKLEFFTPTRQIAHCGHATIATFALLRQLGIVGEGRLSKETIDGNRDILVEGDTVFMEQRAPTYTRVSVTSALGVQALTSLGLSQAQVLSGLDPFVVNTGNGFLLVPLADERSVADLKPDLRLVESLSNELDLIGYYVFSTTTQIPGRHAGARMFAPRFGVPEEAGTGMAAGPLACLLHDHLGVADLEILIEQGRLMQPPSPSVIKVVLDVAGGRIAGLMAGGTARAMSSVRVEV
ncbi:PhzF family phenazine biosynthesis protein [Marinobacter sp. X15-166B]|uniref:PhzF family phenazine biosynthesis protein n=1 Tax=Marinobacter sp. X15-166B TaxID=1897620 RepID=UPI00085CD614|nr:PhzF family phenazine biosynthesis protein [Marinobacter sp. X15-166B]OEY68088.1 phenazine biosynthesis protein [Marinobacter sp. X15-166B]